MDIANSFQKSLMIAKIEKVQRLKLRNLYLGDFNLTEFPPLLLNCDSLHGLYIQRNQLSELPSNISLHLKNLSSLSLQFNNFHSFPECLREITGLVSLNISHNPIKALISDIDCFRNLKCLWCNACELTSLPESFGNLIDLDTFGARNNEIKVLPNSICELINLKWLTLDGNCLDSLPEELYKMSSLHHLNLNRNQFTKVPEVLSKTDTIISLQFQENHIEFLDRELMERCLSMRINLLGNPLLNAEEFSGFHNLILNVVKPRYSGIREIDMSDPDWDNSNDTDYLNYVPSTSSDSDNGISIPILSKIFVAP